MPPTSLLRVHNPDSEINSVVRCISSGGGSHNLILRMADKSFYLNVSQPALSDGQFLASRQHLFLVYAYLAAPTNFFLVTMSAACPFPAYDFIAMSGSTSVGLCTFLSWRAI